MLWSFRTISGRRSSHRRLCLEWRRIKLGEISTLGSGGEAVDVGCPGEEILGCAPGNRYVTMSGTSMATPFFAGVMAFKLSAHTDSDVPLQAAHNVRAFVRQHAEDRGQPGKDVRWGWGTPDLGGLVDAVIDDDTNYWL